MIEVKVHQQLRAFLRGSGERNWPHQLTMARLVARALRLGRSALIQTGVPCNYQGRHRLSYLLPVLMWSQPAVLVAPSDVQQRLLMVEIPRLQQWMGTSKPIRTGTTWPGADFTGLLLTTPDAWLQDRLLGRERFPPGIPTILDGVDELEAWTRNQLMACIRPSDWHEVMLAFPHQTEIIRDARVQLTRAVFQHPPSPYECWEIESETRAILRRLYESLLAENALAMPDAFRNFAEGLYSEEQLIWAEIVRSQGLFSLHRSPVQVRDALTPIWPQQPVVLIGGALDVEASAPVYCAGMGLTDLTTLKFSADPHNELIHLYLPEGLPLPNTPQFGVCLLQEIRSLLAISASGEGLTVILIGDVPLKDRIGAVLAADFGSRVQVEKIANEERGILVAGWEFWRQHQATLPPPMLLAIATLPIPSLEHPLVAGRVAYYKRKRLDWFRLYLLPVALNQLQWAIAPVRERLGIVALLDSRVIHRSYGQSVLAALGPLARINYLDPSWFTRSDYSLAD